MIPVCNAAPYLKNRLDRIHVSDYSEFGILLIDDGQTDERGIVCDEYARPDDRIRIFHTENRGVCAERNQKILLRLFFFSVKLFWSAYTFSTDS
ncbi:MAG: glycosyltransferase family 2 protein [Clostridiales bacterium]|nr:glycosyltransferase family 2 protein [Clostridiales bacterium]